MARLKNSLTFQHSGPEFRAGQGQDFFCYSFSEMQPLVYLTSFAPSLSSQHRSILRCLSEEFSTYRAHPQRSALLFHHLSTPPLRAPLPRGTESPTAWWPLAGRSGCRWQPGGPSFYFYWHSSWASRKSRWGLCWEPSSGPWAEEGWRDLDVTRAAHRQRHREVAQVESPQVSWFSTTE